MYPLMTSRLGEAGKCEKNRWAGDGERAALGKTLTEIRIDQLGVRDRILLPQIPRQSPTTQQNTRNAVHVNTYWATHIIQNATACYWRLCNLHRFDRGVDKDLASLSEGASLTAPTNQKIENTNQSRHPQVSIKTNDATDILTRKYPLIEPMLGYN